ncbi:acetyl-CoA carboxylase biotin carboxyl carrier protein [Vitreimonas flagellata]|uniref:acetyl-CoA carboxylase biotin carboxyl carrier protein n=1 Tax=Vitreimonas flagellata TaxID=2560861 RepID=UPI00107550C7|nr:acetyl-CoA carboxylase biotin carboxyl carrier protein [Vitreimonas flagellata]
MSEKKTQAIDPDLVRELASILSDSGLSEIEVEHGELRLRLARTLVAAAAPVHTHVVATAPTHVAAPAAPPPAAAPAPAAEAASHPGAVSSPMVGTAYLSPEPGAATFIKVGDSVSAGQTLMVVEAMKTFNPIPAPRAGKVVAILVADSQPVEYGEPLVILE